MNKQLIVTKSLALPMTMMLTLTILLPVAGSARAQENRFASGRNVPTALSQPKGPTDPAELETFLDQLLGKQMEEYHIAGAAVSVVKDGKLFFAKGYGYADLEKRIPVDPEQAVFQIGSVTKLFTWTALMQLVEQGRLKLLFVAGTVLAWKNSYWGIITRLYYTLVTVAAVAFVWFLNNWNLLGWRY